MFSGTGFQAILQIVVVMVLARLLTPADFGVVGAALIVVGFSELLSQLGIGQAIVQRSNLELRHIRTGFISSLFSGMLLTAFIFLTAPVIAGFFRMEEFASVLRVMSLVFLLQGFSVVSKSLLQRELKFRCIAQIQVVSYALGYGIVGVCLALLKFGVWALVIAHLSQAALRCVILLVVQPHPKSPQFDRDAFNELIYFGSGFTAARIFNYIALQGDNIVVGRWLGPIALGLYGRAYQLMVLPVTLLGQTLDRVLFPAMAKVQREQERLTNAYRRGVALIALFILPMSVGMIVLAPEFIHALLGPSWTGAIAPFRILTIGMLFRTNYKISHSLARATGAVYPNAWRQAIYAAFVVVGAWIGKHWGISGVACGVLGAITVNFILMAQLSLSLTSMTLRTFFSAHIPALSLATIIFVEVWCVAHVMRNAAMPALLVLFTAIGLTSFTFCLLAWLMPKRVLGQDGLWMLQTLVGYLPKNNRIFLGWLKKNTSYSA